MTIYVFAITKGLYSIAFDILVPYTCEVYNTSIRSIAFSLFNTIGRIGGSMMPLLVFPVFEKGFTHYMLLSLVFSIGFLILTFICEKDKKGEDLLEVN